MAKKLTPKEILGPQGDPFTPEQARKMCDPLGSAIEAMVKAGTLPPDTLNKIKGKTLTREEAMKIVGDGVNASRKLQNDAFDKALNKSISKSKPLNHW